MRPSLHSPSDDSRGSTKNYGEPGSEPGALRGLIASATGQLSLPLTGVMQQLGFDGRPVPNEVRPLLGTLHGLSDRDGCGSSEGNGAKGGRALAAPSGHIQLELEPRAAVWQRQQSMWDLLGPDKTPEGEIVPETGERSGKCHKVRIKHNSPVVVRRDKRGAWSHGNLMRCGSAHACPVCASRRAHLAAAELSCGISLWLKENPLHDVWMLTLTVPHTAGDAEEEILGRLTGGWTALQQDKRWRRWRKRFGVRYVVRCFDSTVGGKAGWHPHFHVALFVARATNGRDGDGYSRVMRGMDASEYKYQLSAETVTLAEIWADVLVKGGLPEAQRALSESYGANLGGADKAARYLCKWGLADEVALGVVKPRNQFQLLDEWRMATSPSAKAELAAVFRRFVAATKGLAVVTGLERLRKGLDITEEKVAEYLASVRIEPEPVAPIEVWVPGALLGQCIALGWHVVHGLLEAIVGQGLDPQITLIRLLEYLRHARNTS